MAKYRPLEKKEKEILQRQVARMNTSIDYYDYREEHFNLMINKGAFQDYKMGLEAYRMELRKVKEERNILESSLKVCNEQLTKGVEITEKAKETRKEVKNMVEQAMEEKKDGN